jgi:glutaredoxin|tara:strand:+ start:323 stop:568 length:246 start_codon:yes stop_codon:yes gene_type:complete
MKRKIIYTKDMCGACIALKKDLDRQGIKYEERSLEQLESQAEDVDEKAFESEIIGKVIMKGKDLKSVTLPIEYDYYQAEKL